MGDPSVIPVLRRSPKEGIGYPLQYSWASMVLKKVKNPPAMWETWFDPWVGNIPWRRAWQPTPVFLPGESPWATGHEVAESDMTERLSTALSAGQGGRMSHSIPSFPQHGIGVTWRQGGESPGDHSGVRCQIPGRQWQWCCLGESMETRGHIFWVGTLNQQHPLRSVS